MAAPLIQLNVINVAKKKPAPRAKGRLKAEETPYDEMYKKNLSARGRALRAEIAMASHTVSVNTGQKISTLKAADTNEVNANEYRAAGGLNPFARRIKSVTTSQTPLTIVKLAVTLLVVAMGERWEEIVVTICNTRA